MIAERLLSSIGTISPELVRGPWFAIALVGLLIVHELAMAGGSRLRPLALNLRVVLLPLLVVFAVVWMRRVVELI